MTNVPGDIADDDEYTSDIDFQVDIWTKNPPDSISVSIKVETAMKELGFTRAFTAELGRDLYYHRTMRFNIIS